MNEDEKKQLKFLIIGTSAYYGQKLEDQVLALYVEDLEDLPFAAVANAIRDARRDPKTTRFPLPAVIRDRLTPAETDENQAVEAANKIIAAVARFGWCNHKQAMAYIGELGWQVVQLEGGWENVCRGLTEENKNTTRAQWRTLAQVQLRRIRSSNLPTLPAPAGRGLAQLGVELKALPQPKENS